MSTLKDVIHHGQLLMEQAGINRHFFGKDTIIATLFNKSTLKDTAKYLACYVLNIDHNQLSKKSLNTAISAEQENKILSLFEKRIQTRLPVEYITNEAYYFGRKFYVNEDVLVPRSLMSSRFQDFLSNIQWQNNRVLDLCTGSGCIGITLAHMAPHITVDCADISSAALVVAERNIRDHQLEERVNVIQSDLFENIHSKYDLIISNPPYVQEKEYANSPQELKNEPKIALTAGSDGMAIVDRILNESKHYLNPKGQLIVEVGYTLPKIIKKKYRYIPMKWYFCKGDPIHPSLLDKVPIGIHSFFKCQPQNVAMFENIY